MGWNIPVTPLASPADWIKRNFVYLQSEVKINAVVLRSRDATKLSMYALVSVLMQTDNLKLLQNYQSYHISKHV